MKRHHWRVLGVVAIAATTVYALTALASDGGSDDPTDAVPDPAATNPADDATDAAAASDDDEPVPDVVPDPYAGGTRDAWFRPFSSRSIWNMPIGSGAEYVAVDLPAPERALLEETTLMRTDITDPSRPLIRVGSWTDRCSGTEASGLELHLPDGWMPKAVEGDATPNNPGVFLDPDGRTLYNVGAMGRCEPDGPLYGQWPGDADKQTSDLYGDGQYGAHGASQLNQFGGAIRPGELNGAHPIRHALDLLIWAEFLHWGGDKSSSYRWPAVTSDSYAGPERYRGANPELRMGSLLALPPDLTPDELGVATHVGRQLFQALQDYGAYVTDDSAWDAIYLGVDAEAIGTFDWTDDERADMALMVSHLAVVANNGPDSIGGGGEPRRPLLPELDPPS